MHRIHFHTFLFYNPVCGQVVTGDSRPTALEAIGVAVSALDIGGETQVSQLSAREHTFYLRRAHRTAAHHCLLFRFVVGCSAARSRCLYWSATVSLYR